jgi:hypothetical protein
MVASMQILDIAATTLYASLAQTYFARTMQSNDLLVPQGDVDLAGAADSYFFTNEHLPMLHNDGLDTKFGCTRNTGNPSWLSTWTASLWHLTLISRSISNQMVWVLPHKARQTLELDRSRRLYGCHESESSARTFDCCISRRRG